MPSADQCKRLGEIAVNGVAAPDGRVSLSARDIDGGPPDDEDRTGRAGNNRIARGL